MNSYISSLISVKEVSIITLISIICINEKITMLLLENILTDNACWFIFNSKSLRNWMITQACALYQDVPPTQNINDIRNAKSNGLNTEEETGLSKILAQKVHYDSIISSISNVSDKIPNLIQEEFLSSSSDSEGPIELKIQVSRSRQGSFIFYANEDPMIKSL